MYGLAACVLLMFAMLMFYGAERAGLMREIEDLREQIQSEAEPGTGGAEVPIPQVVADGPEWRFPIAASDYRVLTSPFGHRISPLLHVEMFHQGLDIAAVWRAQVVAVADGVVVIHWPPPGTPSPGGGVYQGHDVYGGMVEIEHADGARTLYAHMSWTRVHTDDAVRAGEVIGRIGDTGKCTGAHLHFEVIGPSGERLNPLLYVENPEE